MPGTACKGACEVTFKAVFEQLNFVRRLRMSLLFPTNKDSIIKRLRRTRPSIDSFRAPSPILFSPTTRKAAGHEMSFLAAPLAFLVFFSGLAVAQISAPNCDSTWAWVCTLSFPQRVLWTSPDLMVFSSSHSILSTKIHVMSQRR